MRSQKELTELQEIMHALARRRWAYISEAGVQPRLRALGGGEMHQGLRSMRESVTTRARWQRGEEQEAST